MRYNVTLATLVLTATLITGCSKKPAPAPAANPQSTTQPQLNSDGTVAATQAQPQPTTQSPAPVIQQPAQQPAQQAAAPAPPPPPTGPTGPRVSVIITERLSASHNEVGDPFSGSLAAPILARGATVFPRGTHVAGTVIASKGRGRFKGAGALGIELTSIGGVRVHTSEYEQEAKGRGKRTAGFIGGGAGLGAIIGGIAGGGRGAAIGGLAGAGAGTAGAAYTGNRDVVIPSESRVTFRLTAPLTR
jgi:hypothetical protein